MAFIIIYLGITTIDDVGLLLVAILMTGLFGGTNSVIASTFALPKACTTHFDKVAKKDEDIHNGLRQTE